MFDIIFFGVILYFMWKGYKRGFAREIPRLAALFSGIIVAIIFYSVLALALNSTPLPDKIGSLTTDAFIDKVSNKNIETATEKQDEDKLSDNSSGTTTDSSEAEGTAESDNGLDNNTADDNTADDNTADDNTTDDNTEISGDEDQENAQGIENTEAESEENQNIINISEENEQDEDDYNIEEHTENQVNQIFGAINNAEDKERMIGEIIVMYISLIIIFLASYYVIRRITKKKKLYRKIKIPMQVNPALGGLIGVLRGIMIIYIAIAFLVVCEPVIPSNFVLEQIENSDIIKAMYDKNYIANIVARQDFLSSGM